MDSNNKKRMDASGYRERLSHGLGISQSKQVKAPVHVLINAWNRGRFTLVIRSGGSAATASHMATDLGVGSQELKACMRILMCAGYGSVVTAVGNDTSFGHISAQPFAPHAEARDVLIVIPDLGNCPDVIETFRLTGERKIEVVTPTDFSRNRVCEMADVSVRVESKAHNFGPTEDAHIAINHTVTGMLRTELHGTSGAGSIHG